MKTGVIKKNIAQEDVRHYFLRHTIAKGDKQNY